MQDMGFEETALLENPPHQRIEQDSPPGLEPIAREGSICYRGVLRGITCDYDREAA